MRKVTFGFSDVIDTLFNQDYFTLISELSQLRETPPHSLSLGQ